jgi:hypothetical protein
LQKSIIFLDNGENVHFLTSAKGDLEDVEKISQHHWLPFHNGNRVHGAFLLLAATFVTCYREIPTRVFKARSMQGFGFFSTAEEVARDISLKGKNVIVTGGNSGIGAEAARVFSTMGANVFIACRDVEKAEAVRTSIQQTDNTVEVLPLDLGNYL